MSSRRPQDLVFTLFGEYLAPLDRPVWVGSLIDFLGLFDVSEGAVRTVLSRMSRKGWLQTRRSGRHSYYALTARGRRVVEEGEKRIFHPPHGTAWNGRWCLVTYSIPENVRHLRDRLRVRLAWLGFGSLGNGVWVCPHEVHEQVNELSDELGLDGSLMCFDAHQVGDPDARALVGRCWDLDALALRYRGFLDEWRPTLNELEEADADGGVDQARAFVLRFQLIHEYREFPLVDPYLPEPLLPDGWPGPEATGVFNGLHDLLEAPSDRYVETVLAREPSSKGR